MVRKCVIPIAGYGTRLYPATKAVWKPLFPMLDRDGNVRPMIHLILREAIAAGIEQICLVTQPEQIASVRAYFEEPPPLALASNEKIAEQFEEIRLLGERIHYVIQSAQEGFGHAVYCAREFVGEDSFLLMLGDHIYTSHEERCCARQLLDVFASRKCSVTGVTRAPESELSGFGAVHGEAIGDGMWRLDLLREKPDPEFARKHLRVPGIPEGMYLCNFGLDVLTPGIFEILEYQISHGLRSHGEIQLRDAMARLIEEDGMIAWQVRGERHDIGIPEEWLKTIAIFARQGPFASTIVSISQCEEN